MQGHRSSSGIVLLLKHSPTLAQPHPPTQPPFREDFARDGMRISVETVMLVNNHGHPHILLLQLGHSFYKL